MWRAASLGSPCDGNSFLERFSCDMHMTFMFANKHQGILALCVLYSCYFKFNFMWSKLYVHVVRESSSSTYFLKNGDFLPVPHSVPKPTPCDSHRPETTTFGVLADCLLSSTALSATCLDGCFVISVLSFIYWLCTMEDKDLALSSTYHPCSTYTHTKKKKNPQLHTCTHTHTFCTHTLHMHIYVSCTDTSYIHTTLHPPTCMPHTHLTPTHTEHNTLAAHTHTHIHTLHPTTHTLHTPYCRIP